MARMIKLEVADLPLLWAVGKEIRYSMAEQMEGKNRLPEFWGTCFSDGTFTTLEALQEHVHDNAYIGLMIDWDKGDGDFSYIIGMLMKPGCPVPDGFVMRELPASTVAISWIQGKDVADVCGAAHELTERALKEAGHSNKGMKWCSEVYACPRYTEPDENGEIILDYYIPCDAKSEE